MDGDSNTTDLNVIDGGGGNWPENPGGEIGGVANDTINYMKNSKVALMMILVAGLILGGCGTQTGGSQSGSSPTTKTSKKEKMSLGSLLKGGANQECRYTSAEDKTQVLIQTSGKKFYQEAVTSGEQPSTMYAISDGEWIYTWNTAQPKNGIKMNMVELEKQSTPAPTSSLVKVQNQEIDLNSEVELDCKPWTVDANKFLPPKDITFQDLSVLFPKTTGTQPSGKEACKYCEMSANPAAKAECKKSLGCE